MRNYLKQLVNINDEELPTATSNLIIDLDAIRQPDRTPIEIREPAPTDVFAVHPSADYRLFPVAYLGNMFLTADVAHQLTHSDFTVSALVLCQHKTPRNQLFIWRMPIPRIETHDIAAYLSHRLTFDTFGKISTHGVWQKANSEYVRWDEMAQDWVSTDPNAARVYKHPFGKPIIEPQTNHIPEPKPDWSNVSDFLALVQIATYRRVINSIHHPLLLKDSKTISFNF